MALADHAVPISPLGAERPRLAPPSPLRHLADEYVAQAVEIGMEPFPWQRMAYAYLTAVGPDDRWLYPEWAGIVGRQNGKSELLVSLIVMRLRAGRRLMHTAQNRELPRLVFGKVADVMQRKYAGELRRTPRFANGQEEILTTNGGVYRIVAPTRGGARGLSVDDIIVDELREMDDFDFIAAAEPALAASPNPQMIYVSNAGTEDSRVLNALRDRANDDRNLCYLEWSSAPDRDAGDRDGWLEANPAVGHMPSLWSYLERKYDSYRLAGEIGIFETEHLCRWVKTLRPHLVDTDAWAEREDQKIAPAGRQFLGISVSPDGTRASAVLAWRTADDRIGVSAAYEVTGDPIPLDEFGDELAKLPNIKQVGFDPLTDGELAKYFKKRAKSIAGQAFSVATSTFVNHVEGDTLRWTNGQTITDDLHWTARKSNNETGSYQAVRAKDDRPITASLAAIRAVSLASGPHSVPRVY